MSHYACLPITVWENDRAVIRAAFRVISRKCRRNPVLRNERKQFYRDMLAAHHAQQRLCIAFRI
jgi:hypothetical protein